MSFCICFVNKGDYIEKYKDVRLNTIERNLQGEEAIAYLEYVSRELGDVILIERLKIADIL